MKRFMLAVWVVVFFKAASASALEFSPVLGLGLDMSSASTTVAGTSYGTNTKTSVGGGVLLDSGLAPMVSLEVGVLYLPINHGLTVNITSPLTLSAPSETSYNALQIPVLMKFTLLPLVSFGAGAYYSKGLGSVKVHSDAFTSAGLTFPASDTTESFADASLSDTDYGLMANAGMSFPFLPLMKFRADLNYLFGLKNINTTDTVTLKSRRILVTAGVSFGF